MTKKVLFIIAIIFLIAGYFLNLSFMLVRVNAFTEIYLLLYMIFYALIYLLCWIFLLFVGLRRNSKKLLALYQIFWLTATVFFSLLPQIPPHASVLLESISVFGWFVFGVPLAGFDALVFYINNGYLYSTTLFAALAVSFIMFFLGFLTKRKGGVF